MNGGSCEAEACSFSCICSANFTGEMCEKNADPCSYNSCDNK